MALSGATSGLQPMKLRPDLSGPLGAALQGFQHDHLHLALLAAIGRDLAPYMLRGGGNASLDQQGVDVIQPVQVLADDLRAKGQQGVGDCLVQHGQKLAVSAA